MSDSINIGDTVVVRGVGPEPWRGEVLAPSGDPNRPDLLQVHVVDPLESDEQVGDIYDVAGGRMSVAGDPDGMRASDACDDVDVTGRVRPFHRHAVTGRAHAHPGGGLAHTHQTAEQMRDALAGATIHRAPEVGSPLPQRMAHLLVRSTMALAYEGICPSADADTDEATLTEAVALVRSEFDDHQLWDTGMLADTEHPVTGCRRCEARAASGYVRPSDR